MSQHDTPQSTAAQTAVLAAALRYGRAQLAVTTYTLAHPSPRYGADHLAHGQLVGAMGRALDALKVAARALAEATPEQDVF